MNGLPAVARADANRIVYADWFRDEVMRRYREGVPPTAVFREAGLGPEIIGSKRIERCVARWRRETETAPMRRGRPPIPAARDEKVRTTASQLATIAELERRAVELGERLGLDPMTIDADRRQVVIDVLSRLVEDYRRRLGEQSAE
nr:hypothetical protein [Bifidobacterium sp. SO4]